MLFLCEFTWNTAPYSIIIRYTHLGRDEGMLKGSIPSGHEEPSHHHQKSRIVPYCRDFGKVQLTFTRRLGVL